MAVKRERDFPLSTVIVEGNLLAHSNRCACNELPRLKVYHAVRHAGMVDKGPQSAAGRQVFPLPPLYGVFIGLINHMAGQPENPFSGANILDTDDRGSGWTCDPLNLLSKQH